MPRRRAQSGARRCIARARRHLENATGLILAAQEKRPTAPPQHRRAGAVPARLPLAALVHHADEVAWWIWIWPRSSWPARSSRPLRCARRSTAGLRSERRRERRSGSAPQPPALAVPGPPVSRRPLDAIAECLDACPIRDPPRIPGLDPWQLRPGHQLAVLSSSSAILARCARPRPAVRPTALKEAGAHRR